eukprot:2017375-Rhodomonas_salina.1
MDRSLSLPQADDGLEREGLFNALIVGGRSRPECAQALATEDLFARRRQRGALASTHSSTTPGVDQLDTRPQV